MSENKAFGGGLLTSNGVHCQYAEMRLSFESSDLEKLLLCVVAATLAGKLNYFISQNLGTQAHFFFFLFLDDAFASTRATHAQRMMQFSSSGYQNQVVT